MAPIFKDTVVVFSGKFGHYKQAALQRFVTDNGGKTSSVPNAVTTHLVTTKKDVDRPGKKNKKAAKFTNIKVVSVDWLLESLRKGKKAKETRYLLVKLTAAATTAAAAKHNRLKQSKDDPINVVIGRKRPLSELSPNCDGRTRANNSGDKINDERPAKKLKDVHDTESGPLLVAVDVECPLATTHKVHITDPGQPYPAATVMDAMLTLTDIEKNCNKFFKMQILKNESVEEYVTWIRTGRIGAPGRTKMLGNGSLEDAIKQFEAKFKGNTGLDWEDRTKPPRPGKYSLVEHMYGVPDESKDAQLLPSVGITKTKQGAGSSKQVEFTLDTPVQRLLELILNPKYLDTALADLKYDSEKLPLGRLSKRTIHQAFSILKTLAGIILDPSKAQVNGETFQSMTQRLSNQYYSIIPHAFGRKRLPNIFNQTRLKNEVDLLDKLTDMEVAAELMNNVRLEDGNGNAMHPLDWQFKRLNLKEMTALSHDSVEFKELSELLVNLKGNTHFWDFKVQDIFRITRNGESKRSKRLAVPKASYRLLLWHGSRCTNFAGILSQGLRIAPREAPATGYMFGRGIYLADIATKSAYYCHPQSSGDIGLLLLCEAQLGWPMYKKIHGDPYAREIATNYGFLSTLGKGPCGPAGWKDAGCVHENLRGVLMPDASKGLLRSTHLMSLQYNEYIAYDVRQIQLRYVLRVKMTHTS